MNILIPVLTLGVLGFLFGLGLAFASRKFCVVTDPRLDKVLKSLPGANCGACGMPGCLGFAEGLIKGACTIGQCAVMQDEHRQKLAQLLGIKLEEKTKTVAVLHCYGGKKVKDRFRYNGLQDCIAADLLMAGQKECLWDCLGFSTCSQACPFGAIIMTKEGLPIVIEDRCRSCGRCVEVCPKRLFSLIPQTAKVYIACSCHDLGKDTKAICPVGCIACRKCEQVCPVDAIHVVDNLAVIDYNKCTSCGECVKVCPMRTIQMRVNAEAKSTDSANKGQLRFSRKESREE